MAHDLTTPNPAQTGGAANTPTPAPAPAAVSSTSVANPNASNGNPVRPGGAPARVYMNEKIVPYLLEGMKGVTREQPANPLRVLGEFLIQKSNEVEGQGQGTSGKAPE
ncbi:DPY30/SDC1 family protein [Aspergillus undulatus]|uniref:DPY30/SDC1 family protein n=1 Tax=Aspergillus undulatus TaxID=1810928 RepID=UPI003CCD4D69